MSPLEHTITTGGRDFVPQAAILFASSFTTDPVITYFLHTMPLTKRLAYLTEYFNALLTAAALNDAKFTEIDGFKSCVTVMPPGKKADNFATLIPAGLIGALWNIGFGGCSRMIYEYAPMSDRCKKKGLLGQTRYYYVFFAATHASAQGQGLCPKLIEHWQEIATREKIPIWLEATTEKSMRVYLRCGFVVIEELRLGKGKVGEDGMPVAGKGKEELEGVPVWGMVWWPEGIKPVSK
ncbi:hypothetical protein EG329_001373 [Mollisiaceae sp. DMI_Dod_QoI]|nr:hypothetical protein EG329_001373 [Helotiales sp. DMI_Dod_QoI]